MAYGAGISQRTRRWNEGSVSVENVVTFAVIIIILLYQPQLQQSRNTGWTLREAFSVVSLWFPVLFSALCGALLVAPELALSCWCSAASFRASPRPCVMNKEALPLFPRVLFPGCYAECVLLTKPVMDVGLPSACVFLTKRASACTTTHTHTGKHTNTHTPQTYTQRHP